MCCKIILLDLSSAFDTLDHNILISCLTLMGISVLTLKLFTSYLTNSNISIMIENLTRLFLYLTTVFPKGPIADLINDIQIYTTICLLVIFNCLPFSLYIIIIILTMIYRVCYLHKIMATLQ